MTKEKESFLEKFINPEYSGHKTESGQSRVLGIGSAQKEYFPASGGSAEGGKNGADRPASPKLQRGEEGQLAVDVYETSSAIIAKSIIGGVKSADIDISISNDVLTVKGVRKKQEGTGEEVNYFVSECFWGPFSRSIVLPVSVDADNIKASLKDGVLKIELPKLSNGEKIKKIEIKEE
ncbi:Hsp20/alpha crystallin family protein [Patescibacteria group bacterium]|nr:Hsp20/alpha crystallin family protein [Patescibacteria group bacterium]MBU4000345.1 Hsp20/alpha crystallin family protein [Patescibacteria group bacterium]MBU4056733.1 Hsp20/alpha crystallin family protein [Patescibacteria group bacterium]MBU4368159.1 Hsp20/alpha crystallin family protein [Patescibacteria group bacterium]